MSVNPYSDIETTAANQYGVNPAWFEALTTVESSQNPNAVSPAGAIGLGQLMPNTAASLGVTDPYDPVQNANGSANYFSQMLQKAGGSYPLAVQYYNCGPGKTCPAGQAEATAVQNQFINQAIGGPGSTYDGPNGYNAVNSSTSTGIAGWITSFASRAGIIGVGALLVVLAVVIPNRKTILEMAPK